MKALILLLLVVYSVGLPLVLASASNTLEDNQTAVSNTGVTFHAVGQQQKAVSNMHSAIGGHAYSRSSQDKKKAKRENMRKYSDNKDYYVDTKERRGDNDKDQCIDGYQQAIILTKGDFDNARKAVKQTEALDTTGAIIQGRLSKGKWVILSGHVMDIDFMKEQGLFAHNEPSNFTTEVEECMSMNPNRHYKLNNVPCNWTYPYLCEKVNMPRYNGSYALVTEWNKASVAATKCPAGFKLAIILGKEDLKRAKTFAKNVDIDIKVGILIQGQLDNGKWKLLNGDQLNITKMQEQKLFCPGEPNNATDEAEECLAMTPHKQYKLNNVPCFWKYPILCEEDIISSDDGTLILSSAPMSIKNIEKRCPEGSSPAVIQYEAQRRRAKTFLKGIQFPPDVGVAIQGQRSRETRMRWQLLSGIFYNSSTHNGTWSMLFASGEPTKNTKTLIENCLSIDPHRGYKLNNVPCDGSYPVLCEKNDATSK